MVSVWVGHMVAPGLPVTPCSLTNSVAYKTKSGVLSALKGRYGCVEVDDSDLVVFRLYKRVNGVDTVSDSRVVFAPVEVALPDFQGRLSVGC